MLTGDENIEDFKEVTDAQKTALEASDAKWKRPSDYMIEQFNLLANRLLTDYGRYNVDTGFFELGTVINLTVDDVREILFSPNAIFYRLTSAVGTSLMYKRKVRAIFPMALSEGASGYCDLTTMFHTCEKIEEIILLPGYIKDTFRAFYNCYKLRVLSLASYNTLSAFGETFSNCSSLEIIKAFPSYNCSISFSQSPKLSLDSLKRVIAAKSGDKSTTLTLHPTTFARLTEEIIATAAAKNIQFATV